MRTIALIKSNVVNNVAIWDGASPWATPGFQQVDVTSVTPMPGPGWSYNGSTFTAPTVVAISTSIEDQQITNLALQVAALNTKDGIIPPVNQIVPS